MLRSKPVPVVSSLGAAIFGIVIALGAALLVIPIFPESEDLVVGNIVTVSYTHLRAHET